MLGSVRSVSLRRVSRHAGMDVSLLRMFKVRFFIMHKVEKS
jgi:hypothetical protein